MNIAGVVVTYNRKTLLRQCLQSLRGQTRPLDEIIVVDNGSTDGTKEWLDSQSDLFVIHQSNTGGAGGFHSGIKAAHDRGHDWIWCMDDDVVPFPDCLEILVHRTCTQEDAVALVPRRLYENGKGPRGHEKIIDERWYSIFDFRIPGSYLVPIQVFTFEGPLIASRSISKIGYPDINYFMLFDDVDYAYRLSRKGNCFYVEEAKMLKIIPTIPDFTKGSSKLKQYYRWRNYIYFMRKSLGWKSSLKIPWRLIKDGIKIIFQSLEQRSFRPLQFLGIMLISITHAILGKMGRREPVVGKI